MGGIPTNINGQVVVPGNGKHNEIVNGLYAIGECSCVSVHGANRLGSNSLLDLVVFGRAAALRAKEKLKPHAPHKKLHSDCTDWIVDRFNKMRFASGELRVSKIRSEMQHTMQKYASVFRVAEVFEEGKKAIKEDDKIYDEKWKKYKKIKEGVSMLKFNDFLKEAKKCILVCANCHAEIHEEIINNDLLKKNLKVVFLNYQIIFRKI